MTSESKARPRAIGAIAGVGPATVIVGYFVITGGEVNPGLAVIVAVAVVAGWLVGPRANGPLQADLVAAAAYFMVAYLLNLAFGIVAAIWRNAADGPQNDPSGVIVSVGQTILAALIYFPVFAIFLLPVAAVWIGIVRLLRGSDLAPS